MTSSTDRERLAAIRSRLADASTNWQLGAGGTEIFAVVVKGTAPVAVVELTNDCGYVDRDFMLNAHGDVAFLLGLVQRAAEKIRRIEKPEERQLEQAQRKGDFAAECGMRCGDQAFRQFLLERKGAGDVSDDTRVASHVRYLLKVESRGELNNSAEARNRWFDLRSEFEAWMRVSA